MSSPFPSAASSSSGSDASTSPSRFHEASLVDASLHHPALVELRALSVNDHLINYLVDCVAEVVQHAMLVTHAHQQQPNQPTTAPPRLSRSRKAALLDFVGRVVASSKASTSMLLVALVYIHRARPHLRVSVDEWALERVFLGALILASKYTNDVGLKNRHWAVCTGVFGRRDVSRVEREFLEVLDFELGITDLDLLRHYAGLTLQAKGRRTVRDVAMGESEATGEMWENGSEGSWSSDEESEGPLTPECEVPAVRPADYFSVAPIPSSVPTAYPSAHASQSYPTSKPVAFYADSSYFALRDVPLPITGFTMHHPQPQAHPLATLIVSHAM